MTRGDTPWPPAWRSVPLWSLFDRVKDVGHPEEQMLSVYREHGVVQKESRSDNFNKTAENRNIYQLVDRGWLIVNRMKAWQGALGVSAHRGIVSGHYICFRPKHTEEPRFLNYLLRSGPYTAELRRLSRGVRPSQIEIDNDGLRVMGVRLPPVAEQRAIADHLDTETARIDALIAKKRSMVELLAWRDLALIHEMLTGALESEPRADGPPWLGSIPASWPLAAVGTQFEVVLGRMLNPERSSGLDQRPYVRNINVRWDVVDLRDLATMTFTAGDRTRLALRHGDLLVNEGGAGIGRTAIWRGELDECYFQKSVLRLRPIGWTDPEWFVECMRLAVHMKLFLVEGNLATIPHVPAESLRAHRFPFPPSDVQERLLDRLRDKRRRHAAIASALNRQIELLVEHRQALITAAVTGELDIAGAVA